MRFEVSIARCGAISFPEPALPQIYPWCWPKGSQPLGTRLNHVLTKLWILRWEKLAKAAISAWKLSRTPEGNNWNNRVFKKAEDVLGVLPTGFGSHSFSICCVWLRGVWRTACEREGNHCSHRPAKCSLFGRFKPLTRACFPCICINEVCVTLKITTCGSNQQFQTKFFSIKREYLRKHCLMAKALITHQAMAKKHLKSENC